MSRNQALGGCVLKQSKKSAPESVGRGGDPTDEYLAHQRQAYDLKGNGKGLPASSRSTALVDSTANAEPRTTAVLDRLIAARARPRRAGPQRRPPRPWPALPPGSAVKRKSLIAQDDAAARACLSRLISLCLRQGCFPGHESRPKVVAGNGGTSRCGCRRGRHEA